MTVTSAITATSAGSARRNATVAVCPTRQPAVNPEQATAEPEPAATTGPVALMDEPATAHRLLAASMVRYAS